MASSWCAASKLAYVLADDQQGGIVMRSQVYKAMQSLQKRVQTDAFRLASARRALYRPDLLLPKGWQTEVLQHPRRFYKVVGAQFGKLLSVYDGTTEYILGKRLFARRGAASWAPLDACLYAYTTPEEALAATFPADSMLRNAPRALIQLSAIGHAYLHSSGMWALANCMPTLLVADASGEDVMVPAGRASARQAVARKQRSLAAMSIQPLVRHGQRVLDSDHQRQVKGRCRLCAARPRQLHCRRQQQSVQRNQATAADQEEQSNPAQPQQQRKIYQGQFGEWQLEESDIQEVTGYRVGLSIAAAALLLDTAINVSPQGFALREALWPLQDAIALTGTIGLGVSFWLIHVYVTPLKRFVQALHALGSAGGLGLALTQAEPVAQYVAGHPSAVWLVGPLFAAITGLAVKEGLCYGKAEAAALVLITPLLLLGHLTGIVHGDAARGLLVAFVTCFCIFAARKYTQEIEADIGDKSVFELMKLPEQEQARRLQELQGR